MRSKNAIEAAILNRVLDRDWTLTGGPWMPRMVCFDGALSRFTPISALGLGVHVSRRNSGACLWSIPLSPCKVGYLVHPSQKNSQSGQRNGQSGKELLKPADSTRLKLQREIPQKRPAKGQTQKPWKTTFGQGKVTHTLWNTVGWFSLSAHTPQICRAAFSPPKFGGWNHPPFSPPIFVLVDEMLGIKNGGHKNMQSKYERGFHQQFWKKGKGTGGNTLTKNNDKRWGWEGKRAEPEEKERMKMNKTETLAKHLKIKDKQEQKEKQNPVKTWEGIRETECQKGDPP